MEVILFFRTYKIVNIETVLIPHTNKFSFLGDVKFEFPVQKRWKSISQKQLLVWQTLQTLRFTDYFRIIISTHRLLTRSRCALPLAISVLKRLHSHLIQYNLLPGYMWIPSLHQIIMDIGDHERFKLPSSKFFLFSDDVFSSIAPYSHQSWGKTRVWLEEFLFSYFQPEFFSGPKIIAH